MCYLNFIIPGVDLTNGWANFQLFIYLTGFILKSKRRPHRNPSKCKIKAKAQTRRERIFVDSYSQSALSLCGATKLCYQSPRSWHFQTCSHHENHLWTPLQILLRHLSNLVAHGTFFSVEHDVRTESADAKLSFPHPFSFQSNLSAPVTVWQIWPVKPIRHEWPIPATILTQCLIYPSVKLHGLFPKIRKTMLDAINVLCVMSKKTTIVGESVQETVKRGELRLSRKPSHVANHRMKAISVDRRVVNRYIKRNSSRLLYGLKIRNFETIIRFVVIEAIIETHCLHSRKSQRRWWSRLSLFSAKVISRQISSLLHCRSTTA